ncbi:MAG: hypothetical protein AAF798_12060, partial [Bacteroidota bacterium]
MEDFIQDVQLSPEMKEIARELVEYFNNHCVLQTESGTQLLSSGTAPDDISPEDLEALEQPLEESLRKKTWSRTTDREHPISQTLSE